jgi:hypothetical protein
MKQLYVKDSGTKITGTLETIPGEALVSGWETNAETGNLEPVYEGSTEVWWDGQMTEKDVVNQSTLVVDEDGDTHSIDDCELRDEDAETEARRKDCESGMHSWVYDPSVTDGVCKHCGEPYGDPS